MPTPRRSAARHTGAKLVLVGLLVVTIAAVAWPRSPSSSGKSSGDTSSDDTHAPVCTQLDATDAPASGGADQPIVATCPAGTTQAAAMLHVPLGDPAWLPPGWGITESTVLLQQNPDGTTDQQFHRIWRAGDFDPNASACAPKLLLDATVLRPGDPAVPPGLAPVITLSGGIVAYGAGFQPAKCQGPPETDAVSGVMHWTKDGVVYDLFSFAVPQDQVVSFASSV